MQKQTGRSMIEMLGVLAIIAVLSIGGLLGYRRAVNNHHANTILDDVNRFAFVILEKSGLPLGEEIPKGDFKESGLYQLTGFQGEDTGQFAITVKNVPKGVCESLIDKAIVTYKVGFVAAGGPRDDEILYDTLNTDLCQEMNDMTFYFGDTSGICNEPDGDGPCTQNSDCCGGQFCWSSNSTTCKPARIGQCKEINNTSFPAQTTTLSDGNTWTYSYMYMNWWSAQNWCAALGLQPASRTDIDCGSVLSQSGCSSDKVGALAEIFTEWRYTWLENSDTDNCLSYSVFIPSKYIKENPKNGQYFPLCH